MAAGCASTGSAPGGTDLAAFIPEAIPFDRSALEPLSARLRERTRSLHLNNIPGRRGERLSRALVMLPVDRAQMGTISFEIESGPKAGLHQCEALGRGRTSLTPFPGAIGGAIEGKAIYYLPMDHVNGATPTGIYDVRNITPKTYEIVFLNSPESMAGEEDVASRTRPEDLEPRPYFSGVWKTWYARGSAAVPIDMIWSLDDQAGSQGAAFPVFERKPEPASAAQREFQAKQLSRNKDYYRGPFGRSGLANHTDRWDEPERSNDPRFSGRRELVDFRFRDTDGCLKVRADCLELLNEFVEEQSGKGRRVQYEVRQLPN